MGDASIVPFEETGGINQFGVPKLGIRRGEKNADNESLSYDLSDR